MSIHVVGPELAYVTRRNHTHLLRVNPATGESQDVVNLRIYADRDGFPEMSMMARSGNWLSIQIQREDRTIFQHLDGYLAIVDLEREKLIRKRLEPRALPGVALQGPGIECVDLDLFAPRGFVLTEDQLGADVSAFAIVSPTKGYCIAHTDIVASSHLRVFEPFVGQIGELIAVLFHTHESMAFDPAGGRVFFPDGSLGAAFQGPTGGIRVYDVSTDLEVGAVGIGAVPIDMTIVRAPEPWGESRFTGGSRPRRRARGPSRAGVVRRRPTAWVRAP